MDALSRLVQALRCLPGVGPKSAQRMVFHLLQNARQRGLNLAACLEDAMKNVTHCSICNNHTTYNICKLCQDETRENHILCIVETPQDVHAIEQSHAYKGRYYVLMHKISPIDGVGPEDIGLEKIKNLVVNAKITEVILALSPTVEGQTTMHFINEILIAHNVNISQLAHGIPAGGELEYLDSFTISNALRNRALLKEKAQTHS